MRCPETVSPVDEIFDASGKGNARLYRQETNAAHVIAHSMPVSTLHACIKMLSISTCKVDVSDANAMGRPVCTVPVAQTLQLRKERQ